MQTNQITKLALKLAGIYILAQTILSIPGVALGLKMFNRNREEMASFIIYLVSFILLAVLGIWLAVKNKPELEQKETNSTDLISAGIIISGLIIFASAIGDLPVLVSSTVYTIQNSNYFNRGLLIWSIDVLGESISKMINLQSLNINLTQFNFLYKLMLIVTHKYPPLMNLGYL